MPFTREEILEEYKSRSVLREDEDERKARLLTKVTLFWGMKAIIAVGLPAVMGVFALLLGVIGYIAFLKTWGFAAIDVVAITGGLALFLVFLKPNLLETSEEKLSWLMVSGLLSLIAAWILADEIIFSKSSRLSELIDALWGLPLTGVYLRLAKQNYTRSRKIVSRRPTKRIKNRIPS